MIIGVISGSETFSISTSGIIGAGTVKVSQSFMRDFTSMPEPLQLAYRNPDNAVSEIGRSEQIPASQANRNHGVWVTSRFNVPAGSFIVLTIMKKLGTAVVYDTAAFLLSLREGAALRRLRIPFTNNPTATFPFGLIEGNFDIVPVTEFDNLSIRLPELILDKMGYPAEEYFDEIVVEREARPRPAITTETITTESGATVKITKAPSRRVINLRKK
jgi:hypothetical protein